MITTYPNQRMINIHREMPKNTKGSQRPYVTAYCDNLAAAGKTLNGVAFKLYCYLLSNGNNYNLVFSTKDFTNQYGGTIKSAQKAVHELEEHGYLKTTSSNHYEFYETPQQITPDTTTDTSAPDEITVIKNFINKNGYEFNSVIRFMMLVFYYNEEAATERLTQLIGEGRLKVEE